VAEKRARQQSRDLHLEPSADPCPETPQGPGTFVSGAAGPRGDATGVTGATPPAADAVPVADADLAVLAADVALGADTDLAVLAADVAPAPDADLAVLAADVAPAPDAVPPAFYAAGTGGWRDWWLVLHPPYTAWHLAYVVIGACLAPLVNTTRLLATLLAFFLAVGVAAHALDELHGRPLRTHLRSSYLVTAAVIGLVSGVALGVLGVTKTGWVLVPFIIVGPLIVVGYNAELFGGVVHNDAGFAAAWGAFPVLTAYVAQTKTMAVAPVLAALGAFALSIAQRRLSTPARTLRRRTERVEGAVTLATGEANVIDRHYLLYPLEGALRALTWSTVLFATALAVAKLA